MISRYFATMAVVVFFLSLAASTLQFAARSQVLSGKPVEETFQLEFTLDADSTHTYPVNPQLKAVLEQGIKFMTEGPVRIASAKVEITPKDVSWTSDRTTYTSTGAGLVAHVKWDTPRDSANGAHGIIYIRFPEISGLDAKGPTFHSGGYQRDDQDQYVLREINTYQSGLLVSLARFSFALAAGVPVGIALHCIYWAFVLRNEKRSRLAEIALQGTSHFLSQPHRGMDHLDHCLWDSCVLREHVRGIRNRRRIYELFHGVGRLYCARSRGGPCSRLRLFGQAIAVDRAR
jgi:hypothetical protein